VHGEVGVLGVEGGGCLITLLVAHGVDRVESAGDIVGRVLLAGIPLRHVRDVDPSVVPEGDFVLDERVSLALEDSTVELDLVRHELTVHLLAVPEEVLRVPVVALNLRLDIHVLEHCLTLSLRLAVFLASGALKVCAGVNDEEEVE